MTPLQHTAAGETLSKRIKRGGLEYTKGVKINNARNGKRWEEFVLGVLQRVLFQEEVREKGFMCITEQMAPKKDDAAKSVSTDN